MKELVDAEKWIKSERERICELWRGEWFINTGGCLLSAMIDFQAPVSNLKCYSLKSIEKWQLAFLHYFILLFSCLFISMHFAPNIHITISIYSPNRVKSST